MVSSKNHKAIVERMAQLALNPGLQGEGSEQIAHAHTFFVVNKTLTTLGAEKKKT